MDNKPSEAREREFVPFTDSLASRIRWRVCDYAAIVKAELDLMLDTDEADAPGRALISKQHGGLPELRSEIHFMRRPGGDATRPPTPGRRGR